MTGHVTDDRNDPDLKKIDPITHMQEKYLILSEEERAKDFVEPYRDRYVHDACGKTTTMSRTIAETYARQPEFYGGTYCATCLNHFPVAEFKWLGTDQRVGSRSE